MGIRRPSKAQIQRAADVIGFEIDDNDITDFADLVGDTVVGLYRELDNLEFDGPSSSYPRTAGTKPKGDDNPYNAWHVKSTIKGKKKGKLAGKTIAIKDNIAVAGLPMMNGTSVLSDFVPDIDATVVDRILNAGGTILGKAHCEQYCFSGGSHMNDVATVLNPHDETRTSGGSSSGCAALIAGREVDLAIGTDQGGSIRGPSSFCGIYGMKPTHGLVPYTGGFSIEMTLDNIGPMTSSVADNALLLEVIAGEDGFDPRQYAPRTSQYTNAIDTGVDGLKIGIVTEGFGQPEGDPRVDQLVRQSAGRLADVGAEVKEVSIPLHRHGLAIWAPIIIEGFYAQVFKGNGLGNNWRGFYPLSLLYAQASWRQRINRVSEAVRMGLLCAEYMHHEYDGRYYAKAQNLGLKLRAAYDVALAEVDVLLMPTTPVTAPPLPPGDPTREESMSPGFSTIVNTTAFNVTGHPAFSMPCGMLENLPVGTMLIGRHYAEETIYRVADVHEKAAEWTTISG